MYEPPVEMRPRSDKFRIAPALIFAVLAMALYVPTGYWMDGWIYRRQLRKQGLMK